MKHRYEVSGVAQDGNNFCGTCVVKDIADVIPMFREKGLSIHSIYNRKQVHADSEIGIGFVGSLPLYPTDEEGIVETYVAKEMYKEFGKADMKNFAIVRKQILKHLPVEYFNKKQEEM